MRKSHRLFQKLPAVVKHLMQRSEAEFVSVDNCHTVVEYAYPIRARNGLSLDTSLGFLYYRQGDKSPNFEKGDIVNVHGVHMYVDEVSKSMEDGKTWWDVLITNGADMCRCGHRRDRHTPRSGVSGVQPQCDDCPEDGERMWRHAFTIREVDADE